MTEKQRKENIEKYVQQMEEEKIWEGEGEQDMLKSVKNTLDSVIKLEDSSFITIDKPHIITYLGTGYSDCGQGLSYNEAREAVEEKQKDSDYFINYNINRSELESYLKHLKACLNESFCKAYTANKYYDRPQDSKIKQLVFVKYGCKEEEQQRYSSKLEEISKSDVEKIINGYQEALERFRKRLNTYLKRYGLSKCDFDIYWIDR